MRIDREVLAVTVAMVVLGVWSIIALISVIISEYKGLSIVTPIMAAVISFVFASRKNGQEK